MACNTEHQRRYYAEDPAKFVAATKRWIVRNPEKVKEKEQRRDRAIWRREYRAANLAAEKARLAKWQRENPEKRRANEAKRRAKLNGDNGSYSEHDVARLLIMQKGRCAYCNRSIRAKFHVDHIIPLSLHGRNVPANLQLLCSSCNSRKGKKHPLDFAQRLGRLL